MDDATQYREYARREVQEIIVASNQQKVMIDGANICDHVPLPEPLRREQEYRDSVSVLITLIYSVPWLFLGYKAFAYLTDGPIWEDWSSVWRGGLAAFFAWQHLRASDRSTGLYYPLTLWKQSLDRRINEFRGECRRIYLETSPRESN